jgi:hypothetical protein
MGLACTFLEFGTSNKCLSSATRMMMGIAENVIKKAIAEPIST